MRSLGEFFGHIAQGVRTDPTKPAVSARDAEQEAGRGAGPERRLVRHTVEEAQQQTPQGMVTIRRTIIEEVETAPPVPPVAGPSGGSGEPDRGLEQEDGGERSAT